MRRRDVLMGLGILLGGWVELALRGSELPGLKFAVVANAALAVVLRRRLPWAALVLVAAGFMLLASFGQDPETTAESVAIILVLFAAADVLDRRQAVLALVAMTLAVVSQTVGVEDDDTLFIFFVFLLPPWLIGRVIRDRRLKIAELEELHAKLEAEQERAAALAAEAERARLAREMHDALSHSVGLMTLQAAAGQRLEDADERRAAARSIAAAGRAAITELDALFGARDDVLPPDLDDLVAGVRASGLQVDLQCEGELPPPLEPTVRRIVQEALTNAVKHAAASTVSVAVESGPDAVVVEVADDGTGAGNGGGTGSGLAGLRERARILGGSLEAGPRAGGGFRVRAEIPR